MAYNPTTTQIHKFPQNTYIDALRWLPHLSTFTRHVITATYDPITSTPSLQTLNFSQDTPSLTPLTSISTPSRITSLKVSPFTPPSKPLIAASMFSGSVCFYTADLVNGFLSYEYSVGPEKGFHSGPVGGIDLSENGLECVSVGEDGRVNVVSLGDGKDGVFRRVFDSRGLVSYSSVKWASPVEFVTGGFGFGLHWWDQRKGGAPVALFKANWYCAFSIL